MRKPTYRKRIIDKEIKENLDVAGAIYLRGPKWCGKTTTAMQFSKSVFKVQGEGIDNNNKELAEINPYLPLNGEKPRLIDEWQLVPEIWDAVRNSVDEIGEPGCYILTGSSTPNDEKTANLHSGAGRFAFIDMKPMSLYESGDSTGEISLKDLFENKVKIDGQKTDTTFEKMAYLLCRGGWPSAIFLNENSALRLPKNYIEAVVESDISRIDGVSRNPNLARDILRSYARQVSTIKSDETMYEDVKANFGDVTKPTVSDYINQLKKMYIIDEIDAWNPNIRSKTAIRTAAKKSFVDPSLAVASMGASQNDILYDVNTYGLLFENLVDRDLKIYVSAIEGNLNHYRDRYGLEVDQILRLNNGKFALVETKLGTNQVDEAEDHLIKLEELILANEPRLGKPVFKMIVTATSTAYTTKKGVFVVPLGCLKD